MAKGNSGFTAPKGFKKLEVPPTFNFEENPTLQGVVMSTKTVTLTRRGVREPTKVAQIRDQNGEIFSVWESAGLITFFDQARPGKAVVIHFLGVTPLDDDKTRKDFEVYMK